jgi:hypothetical protein
LYWIGPVLTSPSEYRFVEKIKSEEWILEEHH